MISFSGVICFPLFLACGDGGMEGWGIKLKSCLLPAELLAWIINFMNWWAWPGQVPKPLLTKPYTL